MNAQTKAKSINCPHCGQFTFYSPENPYRPFCSERCKLIDLGAWASEGYKIPVQERPELNQAEFEISSDADSNDPYRE